MTFDEPIKKVYQCNCSRCGVLGWSLAFVKEPNFKIDKENTTEFRFNKKTIRHLFCKTCGIESYAIGPSHDNSGLNTVMVNLATLKNGPDVTKLEIQKFDGKKL